MVIMRREPKKKKCIDRFYVLVQASTYCHALGKSERPLRQEKITRMDVGGNRSEKTKEKPKRSKTSGQGVIRRISAPLS